MSGLLECRVPADHNSLENSGRKPRRLLRGFLFPDTKKPAVGGGLFLFYQVGKIT